MQSPLSDVGSIETSSLDSLGSAQDRKPLPTGVRNSRFGAGVILTPTIWVFYI